MNEISIFRGIDEQNVKYMLKCFEAKTINYKKDTTIISNLAKFSRIGKISLFLRFIKIIKIKMYVSQPTPLILAFFIAKISQ